MNLRKRLREGMLLLDGGTGTMLQQFGMPMGTIPETLNIEKPEWILRLHRGYIEAGSDIVYANTFGANRLKLQGTSYTVEQLVGAAVRLAREAASSEPAFAPDSDHQSCADKTGPASDPVIQSCSANTADASDSDGQSRSVKGVSRPQTLVALDIGPLGQLLAPTGTLSFEEAYDLFSEIVEAGKDADLIVIETMTDLQETKAAVLAAKEHSDLPVFVTMTFEENLRTFTGCSVSAMCLTLEGLGVDAVGVNCSLGPRELLPIVEEISKWTSLPIIVKPNAGLPDPVTNTYDITPEEFCEAVRQMLPFGPRVFGGCCGTDPSYIRGLRALIDGQMRTDAGKKTASDSSEPVSDTSFDLPGPDAEAQAASGSFVSAAGSSAGIDNDDRGESKENTKAPESVLSETAPTILPQEQTPAYSHTASGRGRTAFPRPLSVCSATRTVTVDRPRIIGERINPTGKKRFREALAAGDMDYILRQAIEQVEAGAEILDVNVGAPGVNEKEMMVQVVRALQGVTDVPLQLDSTKPEVLEAALRAYVGKPIINSVNGEQKVMDRILPLAAKYGAAVVGLTLDENGIPPKAEERFKIAERILKEAEKYGIPRENIIIDCLVLTVSSEQKAAGETLRAVRMVTEKLGLNTCLGVSNISFGLPARGAVNTAFFTMALQAGLTLPIMNPNVSSMMWAYRSFLALTARDENSLEFIGYASEHKTDAEALAELRKAPAAAPEALEALAKERDRLKDALRAITALSASLSGIDANFPEGAAFPAAAAPDRSICGIDPINSQSGSNVSESKIVRNVGTAQTASADKGTGSYPHQSDTKPYWPSSAGACPPQAGFCPLSLSGQKGTSSSSAEESRQPSAADAHASGTDSALNSFTIRPADHRADCVCERCRSAELLRAAFLKAGLLHSAASFPSSESLRGADGESPSKSTGNTACAAMKEKSSQGFSPAAGDSAPTDAFSSITAAGEGASKDTASGALGEALCLSSPEGAKILKAMETGMKRAGREETLRLLQTYDSMAIINGILIPALDRIGEKFEKGRLFLPQLILAADVAKECFDSIKENLAARETKKDANAKKPGFEDVDPAFENHNADRTADSAFDENTSENTSRGRILLATVKGDIHDIGKNIVKVILDNYGYEVIDLGRDVPPEKIVRTALEKEVPLVGLSALMTTTLGSMETTIRLLRDANVPCKVMVGGAVLTPDYAKKIGADYYAKDAKQGADIAKEVFGK